MIKKLLCIILLICFLSSSLLTNAMTVVTGSINQNGEISVLVGTDEKSDSDYFGYVLKPNVNVSDLNNASETDKIIGAVNIKLEGETEKTAKIKLPSSAYGVYTLVIGGGEIKGHKLSLAYSASNEGANKAKDAKNASTLENVLKNPSYDNIYWCLDYTKSAYVANKTKVLNNMISILENDDNVTNDDVVIAFDAACALSDIKKASKEKIAQIIIANSNLFGKDYNNVITSDEEGFEKSFDDLRKEESFEASKLSDLDDLDKMVRGAEALLAANKADRDTIIGKLKDYNDIFNLDFTGDFLDVDSYELAKALSNSTVEYTSVSGLKNHFNKSIKDLKETAPTLNIGTSSGGGGKGGSSKVSGFSTGIVTDYSSLVPDTSNKETLDDINDVVWAVPYIKYLNENNIMLGDGNGKFRPNDNIKREEILKLIIEGLKLTSGEEVSADFDDINEGDWFKKYVALGAKLEVVKGVSDVLFGVGTNVTREDAVVMMYRALMVKGHTFEEGEMAEFTDKDAFSDYSFEAVSSLYNEDVISGYETGEFKPKNLLTRAEAAKLIYSIIKIME